MSNNEMNKHKVLVVDDEKVIRNSFAEILKENGFAAIVASNGKEALDVFKKEKPDAVLMDLKMPDMDGFAAMQELKKVDADIPVIIVTGTNDIVTAVECIKLGAYDFIVKPPRFERLIHKLNKAVEELELKRKVKRFDSAIEKSLKTFLGCTHAIKDVIAQASHVAPTNFSIIIQGETGTGKSFIASKIHDISKRADGPFVSVDIGSMPETLVESELFGHEKGAFTGAVQKKKGFFETANNGTIFIDDIQNIPLHIQSKLLKAIEEKKIYPIGDTTPVAVDCRIIAATNIDIKQSVKEKRFREDLFYRLCEFMIFIPPLRERTQDIECLGWHFLKECAFELNKHVQDISDDAFRVLTRYPWPGNVRELKNVVRKAVLTSNNGVITHQDIEFLMGSELLDDRNDFEILPLKELSAMAVMDVEKKAIKKVLDMTNNNKTKAASILQVDYKTLLTKIKQYGIV